MARRDLLFGSVIQGHGYGTGFEVDPKCSEVSVQQRPVEFQVI